MSTDRHGNPTTARKTLVESVRSLSFMPSEDVMMHVRAIEAGEYALRDLAEEGKKFYTQEYDPAFDL